jgi:hypothetical protein
MTKKTMVFQNHGFKIYGMCDRPMTQKTLFQPQIHIFFVRPMTFKNHSFLFNLFFSKIIALPKSNDFGNNIFYLIFILLLLVQ